MFGIVWFEYLIIDVAGGRIGARYRNFTVSPLGDATGVVTLKCMVDATAYVSLLQTVLAPVDIFS
jgi:uncharacterized protein (DUF486 family)